MHFLVDHRALDITGMCKEKNWGKEDTTRPYRDKTIENFLPKSKHVSFIEIDIYRSKLFVYLNYMKYFIVYNYCNIM